MQKWALDKERFVLTLYVFSQNKKIDRIFSVFWGLWGSKWGLDGVGGGSPSAHQPPDPILTPFGTPRPPENRENAICFLFLEKSPYNVNKDHFKAVHCSGPEN